MNYTLNPEWEEYSGKKYDNLVKCSNTCNFHYIIGDCGNPTNEEEPFCPICNEHING